MEYHESNNKNKPKNWLCRLLKFRRGQYYKTNVENKDQPPADEIPKQPTLLLSRIGFRRCSKKLIESERNPEMNAPTTSSSSSSSPAETPPPIVPRNRPPPSEEKREKILIDDLHSLKMYYWYWGPLSTSDAEEVLQFKPDGSFLVRDSSSTSYLFSISFRSVGNTLHARIEYDRGKYNLYGSFTDGYPTIQELIDDAVKTSANEVYCYSIRKNDSDKYCDFPVRLTRPISRYIQVRSLKYLSRFVIRQYTNINDIPKLPLPTTLSSYLLETPYF